MIIQLNLNISNLLGKSEKSLRYRKVELWSVKLEGKRPGGKSERVRVSKRFKLSGFICIFNRIKI